MREEENRKDKKNMIQAGTKVKEEDCKTKIEPDSEKK